MTQEDYVLDDNGNPVLIFRQGKWEPFQSGAIKTTRTYRSASGKISKYPTIIMMPGDRVFVPGGKAASSDLFYGSLLNRKAHDPDFDYVAFSRKFNGEIGLMARCVERKAKNKKTRDEQLTHLTPNHCAANT